VYITLALFSVCQSVSIQEPLYKSHYNLEFVRVLCSQFFFHLVFHVIVQDTLFLFNSPEVTLPQHGQQG